MTTNLDPGYLGRLEAERRVRRLTPADIAAGPAECITCGRPSLAWGWCADHVPDPPAGASEPWVERFGVTEQTAAALATASRARGVSVEYLAREIVEAWAANDRSPAR